MSRERHFSKKSQQASTVREKNTHTPNNSRQAIFKLPVHWAYSENKEFWLGFLDAKTKTYYRWSGVVLPKDKMPRHPMRDYLAILFAKDFKVVPIDPPITYRQVGPYEFVPGYVQKNMGIFYEWNDTKLKVTEIPPAYISPDGRVSSFRHPDEYSWIINIDVPNHLRKDQKSWRVNTENPEMLR